MFKKWRKSEFLRSVATLMTGTLLAQLFSYLLYPVLTRIYSTEEMGDLGVYMRWVAIIAAIATARFELALPLPKRDQHAFLLFRLALRISYVVLGACLLFSLIYFFLIPQHVSTVVIAVLTIISAYITVWINLGIHWSIRNKKFKSISGQRMINSISVNVLRWIFGVFGFGSMGLIVATVLGSFLSIFAFIRDFLKFKPTHQLFSDNRKLRVAAKTYQAFPRVNLPHNLVELSVDLLLSVFVVLYFGKGIFGSYSHAFMMLKLPLAIIGQSVGQVFFNRCSETLNRGESVYAESLRMAKILFLIALMPFTVLFFFGEPIFGFVFGDQWYQSGRFAEILAPYLMINFMLSPLSILPILLNRQKAALYMGLFFGVIQLFTFGLLPNLLDGGVGNFSESNFRWILSVNSAIMVVYLIFVFYLYLRFAKEGRREVMTSNQTPV
ncbi:MAG: oligosaccharide flippase family protein [Crocinitomicaceae bacterium]